jgi:tRNA 2-thiouridine synthesizing protein A
MSVKADETLDLKGLKCPLPALMAKRAIVRSANGNILEIICDDPLAHIDVPHMCRQENIEILQQSRDGDVVRLWLRRA